MADESADLAAAIREGCGWLSGAVTELAEAHTNGWQGAGVGELLRALDRIGQALERQAAALERMAAALGQGEGRE